MVTNTDRFGLGTFADGETDWDHTDAVQLLDELAVESDTLANRPTGTYDWEFFFATDESILYTWDGTSWQAVGGIGQDGSWVPNPAFFSDLNAQELQGIKWANQNADSGSGTRADPYVLGSSFLSGYHGRLNFGKGWFEATGGLSTDNISWDDTSPYFEGDGIRTTTLQHAAAAPSTPTIEFRGTGGNFGGIRDMTVYGAGDGDRSGTANIVDATDPPIDYQFENVIIRWGGGDGLAVNGSGARIQNAWIENVDGRCLNISGGERCKIDNLHFISPGTSPAIDMNGTRSNISNITGFALNGQTGIRSTSRGNKFNNIILRNNIDVGIRLDGTENSLTNARISDCAGSALYIPGPRIRANQITLKNWGSGFGYGMRIFDDNFIGTDIFAAASDTGYDTKILQDEGTNGLYINGIGGIDGVAWELEFSSGTTDAVVDNTYNIQWENITDAGTRTLINRHGTNAGDPNTTGQWNGNADYAGEMDATIWDTSTTPWTKYEATPDGSWV